VARKIPFTKAHGARNDFLLTWEHEVPEGDRAAMARAICDRYSGIGADGWMLVSPGKEPETNGSILLYNSDGSIPELSGNGTRCAAAFLIRSARAGAVVKVMTGAGLKTLNLLRRADISFEFEMNMGRPEVIARNFELHLSTGARDVTLLNVGNPQCAVLVTDFDFDWRSMGAEIESHPHFPNRTNVSFVKPVDPHTIDVRFYERGAGETMSSGTGSTGAAAMAVARGLASSPVKVLTPAGPLDLRFETNAYLTGPAVIVGDGVFLL
jgi:diaminopimelate epimerase